MCFSRGLAAPVGSALCGSRDFIAAAHRWRKVVGGGMRQAGVIAAAALYALEHMVARLAEDHANARLLADGLLDIEGLRLAQRGVDTNIVCIDTADTGLAPAEALARLTDAGVLAAPFGGAVIRFVTHYGIERPRVGDTRVTLDTIVHAFPGGADAEDIARSFPTLELADIYAVIAYYLRHWADIDIYLEQQEREAAIILAKNRSRSHCVTHARTSIGAPGRIASVKLTMLRFAAGENVRSRTPTGHGVRWRKRYSVQG